MKKVITVLALMLGACASAFATSSCYNNPLVSVGGSCAANSTDGDGTTFTVSLISLTNAALNPAVNVSVTAVSSTSQNGTNPATDTFSVTVFGANSSHFLNSIGAVDFNVGVGGSNAGAAVSSVTSTINGRSSYSNPAGAVLSTDVMPSGASPDLWSLTSSPYLNATSTNPFSPKFVSSEVNTGLTI